MTSMKLLCSAVLLASACGNTDPGATDPGEVDAAGRCVGKAVDGVTELSGSRTQSCTLSADRSWRLAGQVKVTGGAALTIEPGTVITGQVGTPVSFLLIDRGAKIFARGTADKPITFTSARQPGDRAPSDWGGVALLGRATLNVKGGEGTLEGTTDARYGGQDDDDSSGAMSYVRIHFAGRAIAPDVELNALTLAGVGRGTQIDHVHVHMASDDAFEMFGGTVNLRYLLATSGQDDGFDWDLGWRGKAQFLALQQPAGPLANAGIEADNNRDDNTLTPVSSPTLYNVTLVGPGSSKMGADPRLGLVLRRGTAGKLYNLLVTGFTQMGVTIEGQSTGARAAAGELDIRSSIFTGNGPAAACNTVTSQAKDLCGYDDKGAIAQAGTDMAAWMLKPERKNAETIVTLRAAHNPTAPDLRPSSTLVEGAAAPPADGFFDASAAYIGAFAADATWATGWTEFPAN